MSLISGISSSFSRFPWGFGSRKAGNFPIVQKSNSFEGYSSGSADSLVEFALQGSRFLTDERSFLLYQTSSAVATAVDLIASKIEEIFPVLMSRDGEIVTGGLEDRVLGFLDAPNEDQTWRQFIGDIARHWLLSNNFYLTTIEGPGNNGPLELNVAHPVRVSAIQSSFNGIANRYDVLTDRSDQNNLLHKVFIRQVQRQGANRRPRAVYLDNMGLMRLLPVHGFTARSQKVTGDSALEPILLDVRQHLLGRHHNASMLKNGANPGSILMLKDTPTQVQIDDADRVINEKHGGTGNAGKTLVLGTNDAEWKAIAVNNKDMDFVKLDEVARNAVFSKYRIPLPLITSDRQTLNNYETAVEALYDDAVIPVAAYILEQLTIFLLPSFGEGAQNLRLGVDLQSIATLRRRHIRDLQARVDLGVETPNEIREFLLGRDEIEDGDGLMGSTPAPIIDPASEEPIDPLNQPNEMDDV